VFVEISSAAERELAREGYDPDYGARPLKRVIQRRLLDPLSLDILEGKFLEGDAIHIDFAPGGEDFSFSKTTAGATPDDPVESEGSAA
ncbi:MAG: hypothetical protein ACC661_10555, partial [Verrucomicrobiales bacterium]